MDYLQTKRIGQLSRQIMKEVELFVPEVTLVKESVADTMKFIESRRNWNVEKQKFRIPEGEEWVIEKETCLVDCKIYWRGDFMIVETEKMVHYWDSFPYCYLKMAVEFMEIERLAKWKTVDRLINLRMGIRQTEVNSCGYVDFLLVDKKMTRSRYEEFMRLAGEQDFHHHGSHTF